MNLVEAFVRGIAGPALLGAVFLLPVTAVIMAMGRLKRAYRAAALEPFTQLPLRPPGESLRLEIDKMQDSVSDTAVELMLAAVIAALVAIMSPAASRWVIGLGGFVMVAAFSLWKWKKLKVLLRALWDYRLGFMGERVVGEELNQLLASGFRVFHDVPFDGFNIDHVLVGPPGVFAIETKTRRKPADMKGTEKATVTFDGERLIFPKGKWNTEWLEQARRNARTMSEWLTSATGERVSVNAILTLPGWWVERKARGDANVLNPQEIKRSFAAPPQPLSSEQVQRIAHQLTERCRIARDG